MKRLFVFLIILCLLWIVQPVRATNHSVSLGDIPGTIISLVLYSSGTPDSIDMTSSMHQFYTLSGESVFSPSGLSHIPLIGNDEAKFYIYLQGKKVPYVAYVWRVSDAERFIVTYTSPCDISCNDASNYAVNQRGDYLAFKVNSTQLLHLYDVAGLGYIGHPADKPSYAQQKPTTLDQLKSATILSMRVHPQNQWWYHDTANQSATTLATHLYGPETWVGYNNIKGDGFEMPKDATYDSYIELYSSLRKDPYFIWIYASPNEPDKRYVFFLNSLYVSCASNGSLCGQHDFVKDGNQSSTFWVATKDIQAIYESVGFFS